MFHRRQFEHYLCHWVDALHAFRPELQITSNWMYTTFAPKPVVARLDYPLRRLLAHPFGGSSARRGALSGEHGDALGPDGLGLQLAARDWGTT